MRAKLNVTLFNVELRQMTLRALLFSLMITTKYYSLTLCENWVKTGTVVASTLVGLSIDASKRILTDRLSRQQYQLFQTVLVQSSTPEPRVLPVP